MISCWFETYGFDLDMVRLAYEISVERTGKLAFRYIDKILSNWRQLGYKTVEQAKTSPSRRAAASKALWIARFSSSS